jgi:hypothetical protein
MAQPQFEKLPHPQLVTIHTKLVSFIEKCDKKNKDWSNNPKISLRDRLLQREIEKKARTALQQVEEELKKRQLEEERKKWQQEQYSCWFKRGFKRQMPQQQPKKLDVDAIILPVPQNVAVVFPVSMTSSLMAQIRWIKNLLSYDSVEPQGQSNKRTSDEADLDEEGFVEQNFPPKQLKRSREP